MNLCGWVKYLKPSVVSGVVSEYTSHLFEQKAYLKSLKKGHADYNPTKLGVVKIGINSIYGALGQQGSCINNIYAAITVTSSVRLVLSATQRYVEDVICGCPALFANTDSVGFSVENISGVYRDS